MHRAIGKTFAANTNTLKHTVASELVENECSIDHATLLLLVGDDATDEVGMSATSWILLK